MSKLTEKQIRVAHAAYHTLRFKYCLHNLTLADVQATVEIFGPNAHEADVCDAYLGSPYETYAEFGNPQVSYADSHFKQRIDRDDLRSIQVHIELGNDKIAESLMLAYLGVLA